MQAIAPRRLIGALMVTSLLFAACGDDDDDAESAPEVNDAGIPEPFFTEAEAICATTNDRTDAIFEEIFGGDEEPSPEESQVKINEALDIHEAGFDQVRALDSFPDEEDYPEIVAAFDQMDEAEADVREQVSTPEGVTALFESEDDDAINRAEDALEELGFPECGYTEESEAFEGTELTPEQRAAATSLDVTALEYSYQGVPASVTAGPLVLTLANGGTVEHEIGIVKIKDGVTPEDAIAKAKADQDDESYVDTFVGGAFVPTESDPVEFTDVLEPGLYGYACFVETDDGQTHAQLGMIGTFTAT